MREIFPDMPSRQEDKIFKDCAIDMKWEVRKDTTKSNTLKMSGSLKMQLDRVNSAVTSMNDSNPDDPLKGWAVPKIDKPNTKLRGRSQDFESEYTENMFSWPGHFRGGAPHLDAEAGNEGIPVVAAEQRPEWLQEVHTLLDAQDKWIKYINWELQQMQWQFAVAHSSTVFNGEVPTSMTKVPTQKIL